MMNEGTTTKEATMKELDYGWFTAIPKGGGWWDVMFPNGTLMYAWVSKSTVRTLRDEKRFCRGLA